MSTKQEIKPDEKKHTFDDPIFIAIIGLHLHETFAQVIISKDLIAEVIDEKNRLVNLPNHSHEGGFFYAEKREIYDILTAPMQDLYRAYRALFKPCPHLGRLMGLHDNVLDNLTCLFKGVNIRVVNTVEDLEAIVAPGFFPDYEPIWEHYSLVSDYITKETIEGVDKSIYR